MKTLKEKSKSFGELQIIHNSKDVEDQYKMNRDYLIKLSDVKEYVEGFAPAASNVFTPPQNDWQKGYNSALNDVFTNMTNKLNQDFD